MPANRLRKFIIELVCDCTASGAVEYAICLGLILAAVMGAGYLLGTSLQGTFTTSANGLDSSLAARTARDATNTDNAQRQSSADLVQTSGRGPNIWIPVLTVIAVPLVTAAWLYRRRSRTAPIDDHRVEPIPHELQAKFVAKRQAILAFLSAESNQIVNGHLTARHVMSKTLMTRFEEDRVDELRQLMDDNVIRHLLICSPTGVLTGIISDRDLRGRPGSQARDIMTANPITVTLDTPVATIITIMLAQRISCVPVVEHNHRLCGIVTTSDVLMALQCVMRLIEQLAVPLDLQPRDTNTADADPAPAELVGSC